MRLTAKRIATRQTSGATLARRASARLLSLTSRAAIGLSLIASVSANMVAQPAPPSLKLSPETIQMGAFYNGARVRIEGFAPAGSGVLVVVRGDEKDAFFNKKGRVGPIWVNTDKIHIAGAPNLFLFFSSSDLGSLLDRGSIDKYQLDVAAIKSRLACRSHCKCTSTASSHGAASSLGTCKGTDPDSAYQELIRANFVALKSDEGSYQTHPGAVRITDSDNATHYSLDLDWPRQAAPGTYRVEVYACQNRSVTGQATAILQVVEVGFPARMLALAGGHSWAYGILAVLMAACAGFTIDALTSRLRRRPPYRPRPTKAGHAEPEPAVASQAEETEHEPAHHV